MDTPKELFVIHSTEQDLPVNITKNAVINYLHKSTANGQTNDGYNYDEADVETTYGPLHVIIGKDASDELELALRIALHKLDLKHTFMNLDTLAAYQRLVLSAGTENFDEATQLANHRVNLLGVQYEAIKMAATSLFDDAINLQLKMAESAVK